jgi:heme oxygenase (mycobilin-producing)
MITRIVKMTFAADKVETFLEVFHVNAEKIRTYPGCIQMQLLRDLHNENIYYTYSHWKSEEDLNHYRNSSLFREIWAATKVGFAEKAVASSLVLIS